MDAQGGSVVWKIKAEASNLNAGLDKARSNVASTTTDVEKRTGTMRDRVNSALASMSKVGFWALGAAAAAAGALIIKNMSSAVQRVDILNNFPKVMSNMGISMQAADAARKTLVKGLDGLPTSLDSAALSVQRLTSRTRDVGRATDIFLAFNNAILAGGAPMELQAAATEQFAQAFAKGKPDMMEWRSMVAAMPAQLDQLAKSMGLANADQLGEKLRDGSISMDEFANAAIKLNTKGLGKLPSFAKQAENATSGIGTAFTRMNTAIARGIAEVITAIGSTEIANTISGFGKAFENALKGVAGFINNNKELVTVLATTIGILGGAFLAASVGVAIFGAVLSVVTSPVFLIVAAIGLVVGALVWLEKKTGVLSNAWAAIQQAAAPVIEWFNANVLPILQKIAAFIGEQFMLAWNNLKTAFMGLMTALQPLMPVLKLIGAIFLGVLVAPILIFVGAVLFVIAVITVLVTVFNWLWNVASTVFGAIWSFITTVFNAIVAVYNATLAPVFSLIGTVIRAVFTIVVTVLQALFTIWFAIFQGIANVVRTVFNAIWNVISPIINRVWGAIKPVLDRIRSIFNSVFNSIKGFVSDAFNNISRYVNRFVNVGKDVIEGLKRGITNGANAVKNAVLDIAKGAERAIKNFFGIKSPSRMFMSIGDNLMQGLANGINRTSSKVVGAINGVNSAISGEMAGATITGGVGAIGTGSTASLGGSIAASQAGGASNSANITISLSGVMTRSAADERAVAKQLLERVNEELRAKGQPEIGGGTLSGGIANG